MNDKIPGIKEYKNGKRQCVKCKATSGDDWRCKGNKYPIPFSPHYDPEWKSKEEK